MKRTNAFLFFCSSVLSFGASLQAGDAGQEKAGLAVNGPFRTVPAQVCENARNGRAEYPEIILHVREDGTVMIDGEHFKDKAQLYAKLRKSAMLDKNQTIRICGEAKVEYRKMVDMLDACTEAGFWNVSFSTKKEVPVPPAVHELMLDLKDDGSVSVDGEHFADHAKLAEKLKSLSSENPKTVFRMQCEPGVKHVHVMNLMKALTIAGIKSVGLPSLREESTSPAS